MGNNLTIQTLTDCVSAFKVVDKLWVGGSDVEAAPGASNYSINFQFGCQTSETGLSPIISCIASIKIT